MLPAGTTAVGAYLVEGSEAQRTRTRTAESRVPCAGPRLTPGQIEVAEAAIHAMMRALADDLPTLGLEHGDA